MKPRVVALGDAALTMEFGDRIDRELHARVMAAQAALPRLPGITDVVPTYRSLTVHFDPLQLAHAALEHELRAAAESPMEKSVLAGRRWEIPVCFGGDFGPDLAAVASATGHSEAHIIEALCALELRVFLIGFLPGFPYLGELPDSLRLPRRTTPRTAVPANSVAIAGAQAAIYPWQSPGGWHLLGRTPLCLFDASNAARPALLAPGDTVCFRAITPTDYAVNYAT
jgi:KipI family sensor histidine kinase inhibitor